MVETFEIHKLLQIYVHKQGQCVSVMLVLLTLYNQIKTFFPINFVQLS